MISNDAAFIFAAGALTVSAISPMAVHFLNQRMRRQERHEAEKRVEEARQQAEKRAEREEKHRREVADQAVQVARQIVAQSATLNRQTRDDMERIATRTVENVTKMANGNLLDAERRELEANRLAVDAMRQVIAMKQAAGVPILPETAPLIERLALQTRALAIEIRAKEQLSYQADDDAP